MASPVLTVSSSSPGVLVWGQEGLGSGLGWPEETWSPPSSRLGVRGPTGGAGVGELAGRELVTELEGLELAQFWRGKKEDTEKGEHDHVH